MEPDIFSGLRRLSRWHNPYQFLLSRLFSISARTRIFFAVSSNSAYVGLSDRSASTIANIFFVCHSSYKFNTKSTCSRASASFIPFDHETLNHFSFDWCQFIRLSLKGLDIFLLLLLDASKPMLSAGIVSAISLSNRFTLPLLWLEFGQYVLNVGMRSIQWIEELSVSFTYSIPQGIYVLPGLGDVGFCVPR